MPDQVRHDEGDAGGYDFSVMYRGEKFLRNHLIGFALIAGGEGFVFRG